MDMNIQKILAFVKTVEYGSFTKTAEMLNYTQSGISRMVQDLESDWGLNLLERGKSGVKITSDGTEVLPYAKQLVNSFNQLQFKIDELNGLQSGLIRIGTFSSVAIHWLPKIFREFQKDYPHIDYEILLGDYTEIEDWILEGRVDCGFLRMPTSKEMDTMFLEKDKLLVILPENHPLTKLDKIPVNMLCDDPFMLLEKGAKAEVSEIFEKAGLKPNVHFTTWDDYAIMSMVEGGLGISILTEMILKNVPYKIVTKELEVPAERKICFAVKDKKSVSHAVLKFMDYIQYR